MQRSDEMTSIQLSRRQVLAGLGAAAGFRLLAPTLAGAAEKAAKPEISQVPRLKQSVLQWCFTKWYPKLDDLCKAVKPLGIDSIELVGPDAWPVLKQHGMTCALGNGAGMGIAKGFNRVEYHDKLVADFEPLIEKAAAAGIPTIICMSGNREGMDDETGLKNCAIGVKRLMPLAEKKGVTIAMELLNSKVNHKDYMCDHTAWGVELCKSVGSERFKLLYDIYHMQIDEGDLIATITKNIQYIAHFHTGGVPGRNEIDGTQEINYTAVMNAIAKTGYQGWIGHEFIPKHDPLKSLAQAVQICLGK
jgi:hydroxypyruvate isomerase